MIKIKLSDLVNSIEGLRSLGQKELKAKPAYRVGKTIKAVEGELTVFNQTRQELIQKYGEKKEDGQLNTDENGNVKIPLDVISEFNKQMQELLNEEIELNVNLIALDDIEELNFTPTEMAQIEPFVDIESDDE